MSTPPATRRCSLPVDGRAAVSLTRQVSRPRGGLLPDAELHPDLLGCGASRVCIALPCRDHVLKLDIDPRGGGRYGSQSRQEVRVWRRATPAQRELLTPLLVSGVTAQHAWVVMPYCADLEDGQPPVAAWKAYDRLAECAEAAGLRDIKPSNVGWLGDRLVLRDYGFPDVPRA